MVLIRGNCGRIRDVDGVLAIFILEKGNTVGLARRYVKWSRAKRRLIHKVYGGKLWWCKFHNPPSLCSITLVCMHIEGGTIDHEPSRSGHL